MSRASVYLTHPKRREYADSQMGMIINLQETTLFSTKHVTGLMMLLSYLALFFEIDRKNRLNESLAADEIEDDEDRKDENDSVQR